MRISKFKMDNEKAEFTVMNNKGKEKVLKIESLGVGNTAFTDPLDLYNIGFDEDEVEAVETFLRGISSMLMINARSW